MCPPLIAAIPGALASMGTAISALSIPAISVGAGGVGLTSMTVGSLASTVGVAGAVQGLMTAGSAYSFWAQREAAQLANKVGEQNYKLNRDLANQSYFDRTATARTAQAQQQQKHAMEIDRVGRAAMEAAGTARATAGETKVAGAAVNSVLRDLVGQYMNFATATVRNSMFADAQTEVAVKAMQTQTQGRILAAQHVDVPVPSFLQGALQIGTSAMQAWDMTHTVAADGTVISKI